jgi:ribosomal protein S18 acetylase RimI-like enzyme
MPVREVTGQAGGLEGPRLVVVAAGPEDAAEVHRLTLAAFASHASLDPPSGAVQETLHQVRADMRTGGAALATLDGKAVGCLRWEVTPSGDLHVRRVAVEPSLQGRGIGRALMAWAEREAAARQCAAVTLGVRVDLPGNLAFYLKLGYEVTGEHRHAGYRRTTWLSMRKLLGAAESESP